MESSTGARSSGLDVSLLGVIVTGVALSVHAFAGSGRVAPNLIRFFEVPPDTKHPAVMPQDKALILLSDPSTNPSAEVAAGIDLSVSLDGALAFLVFVGVAMILVGPLWAWRTR